MKAVLLEAFGGPENLRAAEVPDPVPAADETLVRVRACALNHLDLWVRAGIPAYRIKLPHVLGNDIAGEVAAGPEKGRRVVVSPGRSCWRCSYCRSGRDNLCESYGIIGANGGWGGYAELVAVPSRNLLPMPERLSFEEAASFPLAYLTAWHMLKGLAGLSAGQTLAVVGAGSGVGAAAVQIGRRLGARVVAASTSADKLARAKALGADEGVPTDGLGRALARMGGADVVFEHVGPAVFSDAIRSLKPGGILVTCGATSGPTAELDLRYVFSRELRILGARMGTRSELEEVSTLFADGRLKPVVDRVFPLAQARQAQELMAGRGHFGKIVLRCS